MKIFAKKDSFLEILKPKTGILTPFFGENRLNNLQESFHIWNRKNKRTSMVKIGFSRLQYEPNMMERQMKNSH